MTREQPRPTPVGLKEGDVFKTPWSNVKIKHIRRRRNNTERVYVIEDVETGEEEKVDFDFFLHMMKANIFSGFGDNASQSFNITDD